MSVLISIKPKWCEKICHEIGKDETGKPIYEKRIEVRKSAPKEVPFKAYIYCTKEKKQDDIIWAGAFGDRGKWNGHVIGEFICDKVYNIEPIFSFYDCYSGYYDASDFSCFEDYSIDDERLKKTCLTRQDLYIYGKEKKLFGWHISDLKIYDKPKALWQFYKCGAKTYEELSDGTELCEYCKFPSQGLYLCEGRFCDETYEAYLDSNFTLSRPPQSWQYIDEVKV